MKLVLSFSIFATLFFTVLAAMAGDFDSNAVTVTPVPPPPPVVATPVPAPPPNVVLPDRPAQQGDVTPNRPARSVVETPDSPNSSVVVFPPPPPSIVIRSSAPLYWFWDDDRGLWFYYDRGRKPHYSRRHVYVDDGRHYYLYEGSWRVGHADTSRHKGWYKHKKKRLRK